MKTIKEFFAHPLIQMALAVGFSTVTLAFFSKRVLTEPLSNLELALPAFLATLFGGVAHHHKEAWYSRPMIRIGLVLISTFLIIVLNV